MYNLLFWNSNITQINIRHPPSKSHNLLIWISIHCTRVAILILNECEDSLLSDMPKTDKERFNIDENWYLVNGQPSK